MGRVPPPKKVQKGLKLWPREKGEKLATSQKNPATQEQYFRGINPLIEGAANRYLHTKLYLPNTNQSYFEG